MARVFGLNILTDRGLAAFATKHRGLGIVSGRNDVAKWAIKLKRMEMDYAVLETKYDIAKKENDGYKALLLSPLRPATKKDALQASVVNTASIEPPDLEYTAVSPKHT